jgi:hypothetical protein
MSNPPKQNSKASTDSKSNGKSDKKLKSPQKNGNKPKSSPGDGGGNKNWPKNKSPKKQQSGSHYVEHLDQKDIEARIRLGDVDMVESASQEDFKTLFSGILRINPRSRKSAFVTCVPLEGRIENPLPCDVFIDGENYRFVSFRHILWLWLNFLHVFILTHLHIIACQKSILRRRFGCHKSSSSF